MTDSTQNPGVSAGARRDLLALLADVEAAQKVFDGMVMRHPALNGHPLLARFVDEIETRFAELYGAVKGALRGEGG